MNKTHRLIPLAAAIALGACATVPRGPSVMASIPSCARESEKPQSKLLEAQPHERLDTGTAGTSIAANPYLATVGTVNRAENDGR